MPKLPKGKLIWSHAPGMESFNPNVYSLAKQKSLLSITSKWKVLGNLKHRQYYHLLYNSYIIIII